MKVQVLEIENLSKQNEIRKFYAAVKKMNRRYQAQAIGYKDKEGEIISDSRQNLQRWMEHFKEQLNPIRDEEEDTEEEEKLEQERRFVNKRGKNEEETPSKEEIERVIKRMKNNKVPGEDGIIVELISQAGSDMREKMYKVIKQIWEEEEMPNKWRVGILHPLHKKGDKAECSNYRGIMLLNTGYKILTSIINNRIKERFMNQNISRMKTQPQKEVKDKIFYQ